MALNSRQLRVNVQAKAFPTSKPIENWNDLQDGRVLWDILRDIDPTYFDGDLPESRQKTEGHWIPRWQNREQLVQMMRVVKSGLQELQ